MRSLHAVLANAASADTTAIVNTSLYACAALALLAACSTGTGSSQPRADGGVDSAVVVVTDTGGGPVVVQPDTRPPAPLGCQQPLPSTFACEAPTSRTGATVCTDAMIEAFFDCFGTDGDATKCTAAQKAYPACNTCILSTWLDGQTIAIGSCIKAIDPTSSCATTVPCRADCLEAVCAGCDETKGSGRTSTTSALDNCYTDAIWRGSSTKPKGNCYDVAAKEYVTCQADPRFLYCFVQSKADLLPFFRGACRDGGNWSKADQAG